MYNVNFATRRKNARDRVEQSKLKDKLRFIEKERKDENRMHDSELLRFRAKHFKTGLNANSFSEAAKVEMYQTHYPGFCYKRNGDHKTPPVPSKLPVLKFSQLRYLVFTDDNVDIDKVLCLHMLSTHSADSLKIPPIKQMKDVAKENLPIERLIEKSKKFCKERRAENDILKQIPNYVVDVSQCFISCTSLGSSSKENNDETIFRDTRLCSRLMINEKIEKILAYVLNALKKSKSDKYHQFIDRAKDISYLKKIFNKSPIQDFLKMLKTFPLLTSCESYYLTPKIRQEPKHLEIRTVFGHLESILLHIRQYILRLPSKTKNQWRAVYQLEENDLVDDDSMSMTSRQFVVFEDTSSFKSSNCKKSLKSILPSTRPESEMLDRRSSILGGKIYKNFVLGNIMAVKGESVTRKVFEDVDDKASVRRLDFNRNQSILSKTDLPPNLKHYMTPFKVVDTLHEPPEIKASDSESMYQEESKEKINSIALDSKSFIRKTSCCACQEKWKQQLPSPKIPRYKKPEMTQILEHPFRTNRLNQISSMIHEELFNLDSYDTRYSMGSTNVKIKVPKNTTAPIVPENETVIVEDSIDISPYDLAKISHEIAEKETEKKLDEFLKISV